ncbi:ABC transporter ATP-binding protein [Pedobacter sp. ASV28]|uniref:ABC transporter ATP-binding protein n=1 Tax=Pedobacter sp. ASV28 TaxID=2795123 RepID=UPI0018EA4C6A|nr:ABC transporter ATP-binding protein [Pedobacter sp. ASV28]
MDAVSNKTRDEKDTKLLSLKDLLELIRPFQGRMIIACILQTISAVASVVPFIAVAELSKVLLEQGPIDTNAAWKACWIAFFALIIRMATTYCAFYISHDTDNDFQLYIRRRLAKHLVKVPLGWFTNRSAGDVKKGMADDVMHIHYLIAHAALELLTAFVIPVVTIIYLISINWILSLVALFPIIIGIYMYIRQLKKGLKLMDTYTDSMGKISGAAIEFVQGISVVKTFGQTGKAYNRFLEAAENFLSVMWNMMKSTLRITSFAELLLTPLIALVTITSASIFAIQSGLMEPVAIVPFTLLGLGIAAPLLAMWYGGTALQEAAVAATKVKALLTTPVLEEVSSCNKIRGLELEFKNVSFSYDNKTNALEDVSFVLKPGTTTALVGRSGSGKSTVAKLIPRFWDPATGQILLGGVDIKEIPSTILYKHISFVFQEVQMLSATVRENITLAKPDASDEEVFKAANAANIHKRIMELPKGYDSVVGTDALFSGGEFQRLSIARALLADTPILVMDEATAFADPESEALIQDALSNLVIGRTLLVIAHRLSTIQYADTIIVLHKGKIAEQGTHTQLVSQKGKYAALWQRHERSSQWFPETRQNTNHLNPQLISK